MAACLAAGGALRATNDGVHLREVMAGANGDSAVQFIVIEQERDGQNLWAPQRGELQSRAQLVFFDALDRETGRFNFPADPPAGGTLNTLIASRAFAGIAGGGRSGGALHGRQPGAAGGRTVAIRR